MVSDKIRKHILKEIEILRENISEYYPEYEEIVSSQDLVSLVKYLLGGEDEIIKKLSIDKLNQLIVEIMISLRYPASDYPFRLIDFSLEHPLVYIEDFFESFAFHSDKSIMGKFFGIIQNELFGHLCPLEKKDVISIPMSIRGMMIGCMVYFPYKKLKINISKDFDILRPFQSQILEDNIKELYYSFSNSDKINRSGNLLVYLYSNENNSYYLSGGNLLPIKGFKTKKDIKSFRAKILKSFSKTDNLSKKSLSNIKPVPIQKASMLHFELLRLVHYSSDQIWDTKKYYAYKFIRDAIERKQMQTILYRIIFNFIPSFITFSAAVLWEKNNDQKWCIKDAYYFKQHHFDEREGCLERLSKLDKQKSRFIETYTRSLSKILPRSKNTQKTQLNHFIKNIYELQRPAFFQLNNRNESLLEDAFEYKNKIWADNILKCRSRLIIPINDESMPDIVIEIYFNKDKERLEAIVFDIIRMIARLLLITKKECENKLLREKDAKHQYIGKLAHEINNWFPSMVRRVVELGSIIEQSRPDTGEFKEADSILGAVRTKMKYFADVFNIVLAEARKDKYQLPVERINIYRLLEDAKNTIIEQCIYDLNYRRPIEDSIDQSIKKERYVFEKLLKTQIKIKQTDLEVDSYETLLFVCIQEMLKNAVINHDWNTKFPITIEVEKNGDNECCIWIKNIPLRKKNERVVHFCRSVFYNIKDKHEGFGTLWLKSVKVLLGGEFKVDSIWLTKGNEIIEGKFRNNSAIPFKFGIKFPESSKIEVRNE